MRYDESTPFGRGFGSLWRDMEDEFADMERRMSEIWNAGSRSGQAPLVWGYTLQVGPDGKTRFQPFGNTRQSAQELEAGWREPFTTVVLDAENDQVKVTAELPGVNKDDIEVETLPDRIRIEAQGEPWNYRAEVPVDVILDTEKGDAHYNNGILELTVPLAEPVRPKGTKLKVR